MAEVNYDNQHPDYQVTAEARTRSRDLYEGWRAVKPKTTTYLFKEPREKDDDYEIRLKRAVVDNWVERIIEARHAVLFRKSVKRKIPAKLADIEEDVDRAGNSAEVFFQEVARQAQIDGIHWVAIDVPVAPEGGYPSQAAESAARHRPFFESIPAESVIDWEVGPDGDLVWAVTKLGVPTPRGSAGLPSEVIPKWKIWYRSHWEVIVGGENGPTVESTGPNTSGVVPLVPFLGVKHTDHSGWPVVALLLEHIILIYNKRSDLDRSERIAAHPTPVVMSPEKFEILDMSNGIWVNTSKAAGVPVDVKILETSGVAFDSIRMSIGQLEYTIRAHALAQAKRDSAQVESADSQREYKEHFNSSIRSASISLEASEKRCWKIASLWTGADPDGTEIAYNRDFDDSTIEEAMISRLVELAGGRPVITRKTLLEALQRGEIIDPELDPEVELRLLDAEQDAVSEAFAKSLAPVAATLPPEPST